jgi:hypothetical protein
MRGTVSTTPLPAETYLWMPGPTVDLSGVPLVELLVQDVLVALHTLEQLPTISVYTAQDKIIKQRKYAADKLQACFFFFPRQERE